MAIVNMDSLQFYEPSSRPRLFHSKYPSALSIGSQSLAAPSHANRSSILDSADKIAQQRERNFESQHNSGRDHDTNDENDENDLPPVEKLFENLERKPLNADYALQITDQLAQPEWANALGSEKTPLVIGEDESDSDDTEACFDHLNNNGSGPEATLFTPPTTVSSPTNDSRDSNGLEDDDIEKRLYLALGGQRNETPAWSRDPSPLQPIEPLQDQICQHDDNSNNQTFNISEEDSKGQKSQQHKEREIETEQEMQDSNSSNGEIDLGNGAVDESKDSSDQNSEETRSRKRRHQRSNKSPSMRSSEQEPQQEADEEHQEDCSKSSDGYGSHDDYIDGQDSDDSEAPRPAKRHRPSSSTSDPTLKNTRKHRLQQSQSNRSHTAPVQTQLKQSLSFSYSDRHQSESSPTHTYAGDQEPTSNTRAEYREWPICGVFKRVIVGDEVRYGMDFSLEEPHAVTCPQHTGGQQPTGGEDPQPSDSWDIQKITGMRKADGVEEFRVAWAQTWMPESDLGGAKELVEEFKARLSVRHGKNGQAETDIAADNPPKRRRGRPRKQP